VIAPRQFIRVARRCPRCRAEQYHSVDQPVPVPYRATIRCQACGHQWTGRIRTDEGERPARSERTLGTSNAPGGEWYSTPNARRKSPAERFTLDAEALSALAFLSARNASRSAAVRDALVHRARALGWVHDA